jgi:hypothetical protein
MWGGDTRWWWWWAVGSLEGLLQHVFGLLGRLTAAVPWQYRIATHCLFPSSSLAVRGCIAPSTHQQYPGSTELRHYGSRHEQLICCLPPVCLPSFIAG